MKNSDYIKVVRLLILISVISNFCYAIMLAFEINNWGIPESLINAYKSYNEKSISFNLAITIFLSDIAILLLFLISYIYLWQLKIYGVYLFLISTILFWLRLLLTANIDLTSSFQVILSELAAYTYVAAVVLTWIYNKNIRN
jgi:hypothetical protein